jgi:hypothetical protein
MKLKQIISKKVVSFVSLFLPLLAILGYYLFHSHSMNQPEIPSKVYFLHLSVLAVVYGACVALAVTASESRFIRRILFSIIIALFGFFLGETFEPFMTPGIFLTSGLFALGITPAFSTGKVLKHIFYRIIRSIFAPGLTIIALTFPLPRGACPAGAGYITSIF